MKLNKINSKGVTIVEVVMTALIIIIFFIGAFAFFNLQNKNISLFKNDQLAKDLINETQEYLTYYGYDKLVPGVYGMYYKFNGSTNLGTIIINQISYNKDIDEEGKYINPDGTLSIGNNKDAFKRVIIVEDVSLPYLGQKARKVTINVRHKECDYNKIACNTKEFIIFDNNKYE